MKEIKGLKPYTNLAKHYGMNTGFVVLSKSDYDKIRDLIKLTKKLLALANKMTESPYYITNGIIITKNHIESIKKFNLI